MDSSMDTIFVRSNCPPNMERRPPSLDDITEIPEGVENSVFKVIDNFLETYLTKAHSRFDEMLEETRNKFKWDLAGGPTNVRDKFVKAVKDAQQLFKDKILAGISVPAAEIELKPVVEGAEDEFQKEFIIAINEPIKKGKKLPKSSEKEFVKMLNDIVYRYTEWSQAFIPILELVVPLIDVEHVRSKEKENQQSSSKAQKNESKSKAAKAQVKTMEKEPQEQQESSSSTLDKQTEDTKAADLLPGLMETMKVGEDEQLESLKVNQQAGSPAEKGEDDVLPVLEDVEVAVGNQSSVGDIQSDKGEAGNGQRSDNLEGAMSEMLKTMKEMNERLIMMEKKQEHQEEFLMESLKKKMSEFNVSQTKEIEAVIAKFQKS